MNNYNTQVTYFIFCQFTSSLVHVNFSFLAHKISIATTNPLKKKVILKILTENLIVIFNHFPPHLNGGQAIHNFLLSINISIEDTENVLKSIRNDQRLKQVKNKHNHALYIMRSSQSQSCHLITL